MSGSNKPIVSIENVSKTFNVPGRGPIKALQDVSNHVDKGEVLVLIGPSGSGKSTLLRALNGLETIDSGRIVIDGVEINDAKTDLNKVRERVGMVFQHFNLFQHKTALENVTLPQIVVLKRSRAEAADKANELLERVGLTSMGNSYPRQLSGGQQQRVAIARALAQEPKLMLFDEPTSALDPELIGEVLKVIHELADEGRSMVLVTHEVNFARDVADWVIFMSDGTIVEEGPPDQVLGAPKHDRLRAFLRQIVEH